MAMVTAVEMGETGILKAGSGRLLAYGLGACVGLCLYDAAARLAVLVHVVLPLTLPHPSGRPPLAALPGKCADTAVPHALAEMTRGGGRLEQIVAALVGGAQIFSPTTTANSAAASLSRLEIGQRNVLALKEELKKAGIPLRAEETGGHVGRTVGLEAATGNIWVRPVGLPERLLISLGTPPTLPQTTLSPQTYPKEATVYER